MAKHSITIEACNGQGVCSSKDLLYLTITAKEVELPFIVEAAPTEEEEEEEVSEADEETI